jgi:predicted Ser/Thr protein kinase
MKARNEGPLSPGDVVDGCRVVGLLGRGGFGAVYRAHHEGLDQPRAVKVLVDLPETPEAAGLKERFLIEARHTARLTHPNIVLVHNVGEERGLPFINMEFLDGSSLRSWMKRSTVRTDAVLRLVEQVLRALSRAHGLGIVHRDIKPDNIMVLTDGSVKVVDFGISLNHSSLTHRATQDSRQPMGTPVFMAPEQWATTTVGPAADVWSVGVMLYELLVGRAPFRGDSVFELMHRIANEPHVKALEAREGIAPELSSLVDDMLQKDPGRRIPHAGAALERLSALPRFDAVAGSLTLGAVMRDRLPEGVEPEGAFGRRLLDRALIAWVPGGEFTMGCDQGESDERPAHRVAVSPFFVDVKPVSRTRFAGFLNIWGSDRTDDGRPLFDADVAGFERIGARWEPGEDGESPVTGVTWFGAATYARWTGADLPGEEQLEYLMAWLADPESASTPIEGLLGSIRHWTGDTYDEDRYKESARRLPSDRASARFASVRGLSRYMNPFEWLRSQRQFSSRTEFALDLGFRCVMAPPPRGPT